MGCHASELFRVTAEAPMPMGEYKMAGTPDRRSKQQGAEVLLIGASEDISEAFDIQLHPQDETTATAEMFTDLRLQKSGHPLKPLFEGVRE
jgi:hypothetical protein